MLPVPGLGAPRQPVPALGEEGGGGGQSWLARTRHQEGMILACASIFLLQRLSQSLDWEDSLEEEMATNSNILAWRIPWTEEPGGL